MRALTHIDTFDGRAALSTWLTRIGVNCALMLFRKKRVRRESSMDQRNDESGWQIPQIADLSPDPEKYYFQRETEAVYEMPSNVFRRHFVARLRSAMHRRLR